MKSVVVLGAGLVARPLVRYLLEKGYRVTVASRTVSKASALIQDHPGGESVAFDASNTESLAQLAKQSDLVVSLLPFTHHPAVARCCIEFRKPMVTTSYVSDAMKELHVSALNAGIPIMNEIGVDPGIDHMSAMRVMDRVRGKGGKIISFRSYCGGLPAPEANDNPFGYKFSWAPRGVLLASRNGAQYRMNGRNVTIEPERLFRDMHILGVDGAGDFEAYPNRDSISYQEIYGLEGIETLYRATLRNIGWCDTMYQFRKLGLLELDERDASSKTYADFMCELIGASKNEDLADAVARRLKIPRASQTLFNMNWLGLFSNREFEVQRISPLDALGALMQEKLVYQAGERDMIVMVHEFVAAYPNGGRERITSSLIDFGIPNGDTSMARTVSIPAAIAAHRILDGTFQGKGVLRPMTPDIYDPVLDELESMGIRFREKTEAYA